MSDPQPYAEVVELRQRIGKTLGDDDTVLRPLIEEASRVIDAVCGRKPGGFIAPETAEVRTFVGSGTAIQRIEECIGITAVAVKSSTSESTYEAWATDDWVAARGDPQNPDFDGTPYTLLLATPVGDQTHFTAGRVLNRPGFSPIERASQANRVGFPTVQVTARWGYAATVPEPIRAAVIIQASRWFKRGQGSWGDAAGSADFGQIMFLKEVDPDIQNILRNGRWITPLYGNVR